MKHAVREGQSGGLCTAHQAGELQFLGKHTRLIDPQAFAAYLKPLRNTKWVVYCKRPFGGPKEVLRYLARYTHRVAISNRRLIASDEKGVTFKWKDYRREGRERYQAMTLATHEFIRRFLIHVLPAGFHRIRYYGLLASGKRAENSARARELLTPPVLPVDAIKAANTTADEAQTAKNACPRCGGRMIIIERFERGSTPHYHPSPQTPVTRIDKIADSIKSGLEIVPVSRMDEVLARAMTRKPEPIAWDETTTTAAAGPEEAPIEEEVSTLTSH
jgi:Putative transposase